MLWQGLVSDRKAEMEFIVSIERVVFCGDMIQVVIGELCQWKEGTHSSW